VLRRSPSPSSLADCPFLHSQTLKEASDEVDLGTQYHLSRYAYIFESTIVTDGLTLAPVGADDGALLVLAPLFSNRNEADHLLALSAHLYTRSQVQASKPSSTRLTCARTSRRTCSNTLCSGR